jgi:hypothetical protein
MQALLNALAGKKTYLIMGAGILGSIVGLASGDLTVAECVTGVLGSLGLGTLRAGVAKGPGAVEGGK